MAGIIMDFEGRPVDSLSDAVVLVRECMRSTDIVRARALRAAWQEADPHNADDNLVYVAERAYEGAPDKARKALRLLGVFGSAPEPAPPIPATLEEAIQDGIRAAEPFDPWVSQERATVQYDTVTGAATAVPPPPSRRTP